MGVEKPMNAGREPEFTEYVGARLPWLRRIAFLLCQDWSRADDLVQAAITSLYVHWGRARAVEHTDAYACTILVRVYLSEQRSGWMRRVSLSGRLPDRPGRAADHDAAINLRDALARVPPRQRATLVLRYYSDLTVEQTAKVLGCSAGTVKSQTAKGLIALRRALEPTAGTTADDPADGSAPGAAGRPGPRASGGWQPEANQPDTRQQARSQSARSQPARSQPARSQPALRKGF
jgi:RNA polymerase sigma-70 factor (sigma-E family)